MTNLKRKRIYIMYEFYEYKEKIISTNNFIFILQFVSNDKAKYTHIISVR